MKEEAAREYPKINGLDAKQVKEFTLLGELGLDQLIPFEFRHFFSKREPDGSIEMP